MKRIFIILPGILTLLGLAACSWLGLSADTQERSHKRSLASIKNPVEGGSEIARDEEILDYEQVVTCKFSAEGPENYSKLFKFHFDLDQLHNSSWAERVVVGKNLEVYINLWSFREYTLGIKEIRAPASSDGKLVEAKGLWSASSERTVADLPKLRFQAKLFHRNGKQSYEVKCPQ